MTNASKYLVLGMYLLVIGLGYAVYWQHGQLRQFKIDMEAKRINTKDSVDTAIYKAIDSLSQTKQVIHTHTIERLTHTTTIVKNEMDSIKFDPDKLPNY